METRNSQDERTIGDLFYYLKEEMADIKLSYSLMILVDTLKQVLHQMPMISEALAETILTTFFEALPQLIRQKLLLCA